MFRALLYAVLIGLAVVAGAALLARIFGAAWFDRMMNPVGSDATLPAPRAEDGAFHQSLFVADLHADTLKWERDLLLRARWGHVDLPRLAEGNVALQVFTIVTKSPLAHVRPGTPNEKCVSAGSFNMAALLAALQGRPVFDMRERALVQIRRLRRAAARSRERDGPELRIITSAADLEQLVADRRAGREVIGALIGIEGGHWVGGETGSPEAVEADMRELFELGVRQFAPTHRFDNALSGAGEGCERGGLTARGVKALEMAERLGMVVDLAHISPQGLREAVEVLEQPFVISHTGVKAGCEPPCVRDRNLGDEEIALILRHGGLIGVGYWPAAVGPSAWRIADVMERIMEVAAHLGLPPSEGVALGSDYDGSVTPFFDASQLEILTTILRRRDEPFDEKTIRNIAGLNVCRLYAGRLPGGSEALSERLCAMPVPDSLAVTVQ